MKINKIEKILQSNDAKLKLKQLGENPANLKASKDSLVIIYDDKTYEIKMINTLTHKHKGGPKEPRTSKLDLILKRLDTVDAFIEQQTKFNAKVDAFITKQEEFNAEQRKFNAKVDLFIDKQEKFNNWVVDVFNKNNLKV